MGDKFFITLVPWGKEKAKACAAICDFGSYKELAWGGEDRLGVDLPDDEVVMVLERQTDSSFETLGVWRWEDVKGAVPDYREGTAEAGPTEAQASAASGPEEADRGP